MKKYVLSIAAATALTAVLIAGCGTSGGKVVAEINGQKITSDQFAQFVGRTPMGAQALTQMLNDRFMVGLADEKKVAPTDAQVNARYELYRKVSDLDQLIKEKGFTTDDVKEQLRISQAEINVAEQAMKSKISDDDVKQAYDNQKSIYDLPERVRTDLIVFPNKEAADKAAKDLKGGADMDKVAKDAGRTVGHLTIPKSGPGMPPDIVKAAFDTKKGEYSDAVMIPSQDPKNAQYVIIRPGERLKPTKISFDEAKDVIRGQLAMVKASQDSDYQKMLTDARKKAKITINEASMKQSEKGFREPAPLGGMPMGAPGQ